MTGSRYKSLLVFVEDTDTWEGEPLYEAIVRLFHRNHVAGATVWNGIMGYGAHGRIHRKGLFGVADEKPVVIVAVDTEEKIRGVPRASFDGEGRGGGTAGRRGVR